MEFKTFTATVRTTPTYVKFSPVLEAVMEAEAAAKANHDFHRDLVMRKMLGELTPEEQEYYDLWYAQLVANIGDEDEIDED